MSFIPSEANPEGQQDIWTPAVWATGPDALVATAQQQLWQDQKDMNDGVLGGGDRAMSGSDTAPQNETDEDIPPGSSMGRSDQWTSDLQDLRRNEPLAAWANGSKDGDGKANPPA
jgi:hypothetical protein